MVKAGSGNIRFPLIKDVLTVMRTLKERNPILGLLAKLDRDMNHTCRDLKLNPYSDFFIIGDQYNADVIGARAVGLTPILVDRYRLIT
ncbi:HAD hydrolase-like protein [Chloroflexota bacterium]